MKPARLPENTAARRQLQTRLDGLRVSFPSGSPASPITASVSGKWFEVAENDRDVRALSFDFNSPSPNLAIRTGAGEIRLPFGINSWVKSQGTFTNGLDRFLSVPANPMVAASGTWSAENTFTLKIVLYETPFYSTVNFKFDGDNLVIDSEQNVAFGPTKMTQLLGKARATE